MFGWIKKTMNKIFFCIAASAFLHIILTHLAYSPSIIADSIMFLLFGLLVPDIDVLTGFLKTVFKLGAGVIILALAIVFLLSPLSQPVGVFVLGLGGISGSALLSQFVAICIFAIISYFFANLVFGILPSKNAFHSYLVFGLFVLGVWIYSGESVISTASFALGYIGHIVLDSLENKDRR
jgi:hypothetical protein